jgi:hypothetical protein
MRRRQDARKLQSDSLDTMVEVTVRLACEAWVTQRIGCMGHRREQVIHPVRLQCTPAADRSHS